MQKLFLFREQSPEVQKESIWKTCWAEIVAQVHGNTEYIVFLEEQTVGSHDFIHSDGSK